MEKVERIGTSQAPAPGGHYSQAVACGGLVYVSGQLANKADGTHGHGEPFEVQASQCLENLLNVLRASGCSPRHVLKVTAYIVDIGNWPALDRIFKQAFGDAKPARSIVPVPALHYGYLVEIDAVATKAEPST